MNAIIDITTRRESKEVLKQDKLQMLQKSLQGMFVNTVELFDDCMTILDLSIVMGEGEDDARTIFYDDNIDSFESLIGRVNAKISQKKDRAALLDPSQKDKYSQPYLDDIAFALSQRNILPNVRKNAHGRIIGLKIVKEPRPATSNGRFDISASVSNQAIERILDRLPAKVVPVIFSQS
ncbi:hypothetical protein COB57_02190 [Candidatus Peregrinibacteria bacterium]|nr:MAG: hypothetical protein COB57_02190 [Candidatus Peregrinibacteria bacterium]